MEGKKFNQFSYQNDFISKNYDRVNLTVPKGKKEKIREAAKAEGKSVNEFINAAIDARMSGTGAPAQQQEPPAEVKKTPKPKKAAAGQQAPEPKQTGEVGFILVDYHKDSIVKTIDYYYGGNYVVDGQKYPVIGKERAEAKVFTKKFNAQRAIESIKKYGLEYGFEVEKIIL